MPGEPVAERVAVTMLAKTKRWLFPRLAGLCLALLAVPRPAGALELSGGVGMGGIPPAPFHAWRSARTPAYRGERRAGSCSRRVTWAVSCWYPAAAAWESTIRPRPPSATPRRPARLQRRPLVLDLQHDRLRRRVVRAHQGVSPGGRAGRRVLRRSARCRAPGQRRLDGREQPRALGRRGRDGGGGPDPSMEVEDEVRTWCWSSSRFCRSPARATIPPATVGLAGRARARAPGAVIGPVGVGGYGDVPRAGAPGPTPATSRRTKPRAARRTRAEIPRTRGSTAGDTRARSDRLHDERSAPKSVFLARARHLTQEVGCRAR